MNMMKAGTVAVCTVLSLTVSQTTIADGFDEFVKGGEVELSLRHRFAVIDQDTFSRNATASTLQTLLGFKSGKVGDFHVYGQFRNVTRLGANTFNNTINGRRGFPVVADPSATEVDQAYLAYSGIPKTQITVGRRKLVWGNKRFVSKLAWRQNHRSFDGITLESRLSDHVDIKYAYVFNVNRAFTDRSPVGNFDANIHLANANIDLGSIGKATAYGYWLDMKDQFALPLSTQTLGITLTSKRPVSQNVKVGYVLEAATQKDILGNPFDINVEYYRVEPNVQVGALKFRAGLEILGGNGTRGFQTPFALLHAYNGWADLFLITPANGLKDYYAEVKYRFNDTDTFLDGMNFLFAYHDFSSDVNGQHYGDEVNASITKKLFGRVNALAKIAIYNADQFATDTTKFWFQLSTSF